MDRPPLKSVRLLDRLRERLRYAHHSLRTEKTYVYWARFFVRFHRMRHPKDMGSAEVESFLSFLANERHVSPSTHRQALAAILYLYKEVLGIGTAPSGVYLGIPPALAVAVPQDCCAPLLRGERHARAIDSCRGQPLIRFLQLIVQYVG